MATPDARTATSKAHLAATWRGPPRRPRHRRPSDVTWGDADTTSRYGRPARRLPNLRDASSRLVRPARVRPGSGRPAMRDEPSRYVTLVTHMSSRYVASEPHGKQAFLVSAPRCSDYSLGGVCVAGVTHATG